MSNEEFLSWKKDMDAFSGWDTAKLLFDALDAERQDNTKLLKELKKHKKALRLIKDVVSGCHCFEDFYDELDKILK